MREGNIPTDEAEYQTTQRFNLDSEEGAAVRGLRELYHPKHAAKPSAAEMLDLRYRAALGD